jgi:hypothetical protein
MYNSIALYTSFEDFVLVGISSIHFEKGSTHRRIYLNPSGVSGKFGRKSKAQQRKGRVYLFVGRSGNGSGDFFNFWQLKQVSHTVVHTPRMSGK